MLHDKIKIGLKLTNIALLSAAFFFLSYPDQVFAETKNSCVECHSNPDFAAYNKKIRNYFLKWENSNHAAAGVTCYDCHGGNPGETDKQKAHAGSQNSIYFTDVPHTCGKCHDEIYESFKKSDHYSHLIKPGVLGVHGANCITCHSPGDPVMGMGVNPEDVEKSCELCHNYKTKSFPEIPQKALAVLIKFNSLKQQLNSLILRSDVAQSHEFIKASQKKVKELAVAWHSFDLETASKKTEEVMDLLKEQRKSLRKIQTDRIYEKGQGSPFYGN